MEMIRKSTEKKWDLEKDIHIEKKTALFYGEKSRDPDDTEK